MQETQMVEQYMVLDSRIHTIAAGRSELDEIDEDWGRYVMEFGTAQECCDAVNKGRYGTLCVVAGPDNRIRWEWEKGGKWIIGKNEK
jgi:hypothetical protein